MAIEFSTIEDNIRVDIEPAELWGDITSKISDALERSFVGHIDTRFGYVSGVKLISRGPGKVIRGNFTGSISYMCKVKFDVLRPFVGCELVVRVVEKDPSVYILGRYRCVDVMINRGLPPGKEELYDAIQIKDFVKVRALAIRINSENGGGYFMIGEIISEVDLESGVLLPFLPFAWEPAMGVEGVFVDRSLESSGEEQILQIQSRVAELDSRHITSGSEMTIWNLVSGMANSAELVNSEEYSGSGGIVFDGVAVGWGFFIMWELLYKFPWLRGCGGKRLFLNERDGGYVQAFSESAKDGEIYVVGMDGEQKHWGGDNVVHQRYYQKFEYPLHLVGGWQSDWNILLGGMPTLRYDFILASGGDVFDIDQRDQSEYMWNVVWREVLTILAVQSVGGCAVIRLIGPLRQSKMVELVMLLSGLYSECYLYKCLMGRPTNSEKFLVCRNYRGGGEKLVEAGWKVDVPEHVWRQVGASGIVEEEGWRNTVQQYQQLLDSRMVSFLQTAYGYFDQRTYIDFEARLAIKRQQRDWAIEWLKRVGLPTRKVELDPLKVDGTVRPAKIDAKSGKDYV